MRIQLDQLQADGTLRQLKRPLYVFTGLQFEQQIQPVDGDVIVVGDCAKPHAGRFPERAVLGRVRGVSELHADLGEPARRRASRITSGSWRQFRRATRDSRYEPIAVLGRLRSARSASWIPERLPAAARRPEAARRSRIPTSAC